MFKNYTRLIKDDPIAKIVDKQKVDGLFKNESRDR